ncbi:MAG: hypothetical protein HDS68_08590 [Bacteroidales bacterium]|nr:hypothetical protein [Bacteroidales bacterium]
MDEIKKRTLQVMCGLGVLLVLWVSFGGRGDSAGAVIEEDEAEMYEAAEIPLPAASAPPVAELTAKADTAVPETKEVEQKENIEKKKKENPEDKKPEATSDLLALLAPAGATRASNPYERHLGSMPPGGVKMKINYLGGTLAKVFNDSNYIHLASARSAGIKPFNTLREAWDAGASMERLQSCEAYYLDELTHSLPYLVPEAHRLLTDIGTAFRDSLQARGGGDYRIKVTSVLRSPSLVKRLRRSNINATDTSAHMYGTTFDISYSKFICDSTRGPVRTQEDMKNLLGEVVYAMRQQGRCHVKYERKQACFHITATGK